MSQIARLYDFQAGQKIKSADVDAELSQLVQANNTLDSYVNSLVLGGQVVSIPDFMSRQAIINGNFDVWQRGASFTNPASASFTADRYRVSFNADGGTFPTVSHIRTPILAEELPGSRFYYVVDTNGAGTSVGANSNYLLNQSIENGVRYLCGAGKKVTLSFYARSNIANKRIAINLDQIYGTGGSPSPAESVSGTMFTLTGGWQKFSFTFTTNTLFGKTFGTNNDDVLSIHFGLQWGANIAPFFGATTAETFVGAGQTHIAQVQLCTGDFALPFMPKTVDQEVSDCQRYCRPIPIGTSGIVSTATTAVLAMRLERTMRVQPTVVTTNPTFQIYDGGSNMTAVAGAMSVGSANANGLTINMNGFTGLTQYRPCMTNNSPGYLDAEL